MLAFTKVVVTKALVGTALGTMITMGSLVPAHSTHVFHHTAKMEEKQAHYALHYRVKEEKQAHHALRSHRVKMEEKKAHRAFHHKAKIKEKQEG